ncbi:hypothetical protein Tco_1025626 [Tanacetum coccineum]
MQELLLKLMNDLQILKGIQPKQVEKEEQAAKSFTLYGNFSMIDDVKVLQDKENLMKDIQTFLRKFSRIPFGEIPKVLLVAWERFSKIKHAFTDKQYQQEDIQELMSKLLKDVRHINGELFEFINSLSWNRPTFYNDDDEYTIIYRKHKAITPDLSIEEPDNSLNMRDEHLNTVSEIEKSSVENLVPIPNISITSPKIDFLPEEFADDLNFIDLILPGIDKDDCDEDDFDEEKEEIDDEILQMEDEILHVSRLITNIESLNDNPTPDHVFKSPSSFPIPVTDSDSFFEKSDTFLSYSIEPDQGELNNIVIEEVDTFLVPEDSIPPGIESNFDPEGGEIDFSQNIEDDDSFTFII